MTNNENIIMQGWKCPKCGRVYSPTTDMCKYCWYGKATATTNLPIKPVAHKFDDGVFTKFFPYTCKCGAELKYEQKRCTKCGQILDWSEEYE